MVGPGPRRAATAAAVVFGLLQVLATLPVETLGVGSGVAWADLADQHYKRALAYYEGKDYPRAIREFQAAYKVRQLPRILLNIGQVYRKLGMASTALKFYEHYLRVEPQPKPEIKAEVDRYIAQTRAMLDPPDIVPLPRQSAAAAAAEAVATAPSDITPVQVPEYYLDDLEPTASSGKGKGKGKSQAREPEGSTPLITTISPSGKTWQGGTSTPTPGTAVVTSPLLGPLGPAGKQPPAERPFYKKGWFWGVVGGVAAAAVVIGVVAGTAQQNQLPATILYPTK